jgi:hypothetical protein
VGGLRRHRALIVVWPAEAISARFGMWCRGALAAGRR